MEKYVPAVGGLLFWAVALALAVLLNHPTALQDQLIKGSFAIGCGAFATLIANGMLHVKMTFGKQLSIAATGALAVFVILYLVRPA